MPMYLLLFLSQSYLTAPKLLEHLQQNFCEGKEMYDHPSVAKVTTQGIPSFLKEVVGSKHISSSWGASCSYLSDLRLQSQQQTKFQVATGSSLSIFTLTVQRGLPPQLGGVWQQEVQANARRSRQKIFINLYDYQSIWFNRQRKLTSKYFILDKTFFSIKILKVHHYCCREPDGSLNSWHSPRQGVVHLGLNLSGSMGPVVQLFRSKSHDFGLPFLIQKNLTGSSLSTVEQQWLRQRPCFVQ